MGNWWKTFFDLNYIRIWGVRDNPTQTAKQVQGVWELLGVRVGSCVLDAPCGYGRLSLPIAIRGANVAGVDRSEELLNEAEKDRGDLSTDRLRYFKHDFEGTVGRGRIRCSIQCLLLNRLRDRER
jgi:2-polyprenyl-3-methyl-5-hydroxy-6-metoxy-1,4-benzoquinol methylase